MSNSQSKFIKQVLVEEAEYDRLRQNHYRNYSPQMRTMDKLEEFIIATMLRKDLDHQQKLDLVSGPRQRFNQLREETNTLNGESITGLAAAPAAPKAEPKQEPTETKVKPEANRMQSRSMIPNEPVKVIQQHNKLMDLIGNNPNIIRRNDANEMEVNGRAVPGTDFDELYANLFSPHGTQHLPGMAELIGALRQLNVEGKDIVSHPIQAAFESATPRSGPLHHNEKAIIAPKPKPQAKEQTQVDVAIRDRGNRVLRNMRRASTTKYNMPRKGLSNSSNRQQTGTGLKIPRILYVY